MYPQNVFNIREKAYNWVYVKETGEG